tara:strand:+ start:575 stop:1546 length:972 start_codon:yes stop_codon:yes gene_type:complete
MKMLGKALFVLTSFFFLCVLSFIVSSKLFGVRPIISWASKTFTEYEVLIHEESSINYFPYLEFDAKNVVLKESDRITSDGFIEINRLKFQINTKKLITQQSVAIKISLDGFDVVSKLNDAHSTNLDTLLSANFDIEGHIVGNLEIGASSESWSELNENINGTLQLSVDNGLWKDNDIFYMLRRARAIYKRDEDPEYTEKTIKQEFNIQASGNIIDGIFVNDDFKMKMPYSNITGSGTINFSSMAIDYSIQAIFDDELKSALKMTNDEFLDFSKTPLPIRLRNQSGKLEFRPDIENIFRNDVEDTLHRQEERLKESIRKNLTYQ